MIPVESSFLNNLKQTYVVKSFSIAGIVLSCLLLSGSKIGIPDNKAKKYSSGTKRFHPRRREVPRTTLYSIHTREALPVFKKPTPKWLLNRFFRCRGTDDEHGLDHVLLDILVRAAERFKAPKVVIISAYRSPKFNDYLRKKARHVAWESLHTEGRAVDFRIPGVKTGRIYRWLRANHTGGIGHYPSDGFIHIDTGPPRTWTGR